LAFTRRHLQRLSASKDDCEQRLKRVEELVADDEAQEAARAELEQQLGRIEVTVA